MSIPTGITALPPETLLQITGYLDSRKDLHSLLSTCKYLHSIAYRELWSVLRFGRSVNRSYLSGNENWQRVIWRAGIKRLLQTIEESENSELPGFEFTRSLGFNFNLSTNSPYPAPGDNDLLSTFLETAMPKMLGLSRIALNLDSYVDLEVFKKDRGRFYDILKEYLSSKSPQEFSMAIILDGSDGTDAHLRPDRIYTMLRHFDLAKLTSLELRLGLRNRWLPNRWETPEDRSKAAYLGLTGLSGNALAVVAALTRIFRATVRLKRLRLLCIPWLSRPGLAYQWFSVNEIADPI
ncbi:hypothetical protein H072_7501 [Dactylellina haptotyla CBS 200.50]|uniref:F-box domain-containing protein n=1 Tax=Dactylellina haptotyla (strain CBS 200.50) TaxID=1284197 RepID=S8BTT1_DACHA|nr:hypothetical protein H072_7501 [Dactylellina haptotyla CBS 200.50]